MQTLCRCHVTNGTAQLQPAPQPVETCASLAHLRVVPGTPWGRTDECLTTYWLTWHTATYTPHVAIMPHPLPPPSSANQPPGPRLPAHTHTHALTCHKGFEPLIVGKGIQHPTSMQQVAAPATHHIAQVWQGSKALTRTIPITTTSTSTNPGGGGNGHRCSPGSRLLLLLSLPIAAVGSSGCASLLKGGSAARA